MIQKKLNNKLYCNIWYSVYEIISYSKVVNIIENNINYFSFIIMNRDI